MLRRSLPFALALLPILTAVSTRARADDDANPSTAPTTTEPTQSTEPDPNAPSEPDPNDAPLRGKDDTHTWIEARLGYVSADKTGWGTFGGALGIGFTWIDFGANIGVIHQFDDDHLTSLSVGPEVAFRRNLGGGATFRLGVDPVYGVLWSHGHNVGLYGGDLLGELLFTVDDSSPIVTRMGVGFHGGVRWLNSSANVQEDHFWIVGADFIVRSWW